jgi:uncharacterized Zn finger protein
MQHQNIVALDQLLDRNEAQYLKGDRIRSNVTQIRVAKEVISASVKSERGNDKYEVIIDLNRRTRKCACPAHKHYAALPCKHVIATAIIVREILSLVQ